MSAQTAQRRPQDDSQTAVLTQNIRMGFFTIKAPTLPPSKNWQPVSVSSLSPTSFTVVINNEQFTNICSALEIIYTADLLIEIYDHIQEK